MEPWQSWAIAVAGGGVAYWYYNYKNQPAVPARARASTGSEPNQVPPKGSKKKEEKSRRKTLERSPPPENVSSDATTPSAAETKSAVAGGQGKKRKAGKKATAVTPAPPTVTVVDNEPEQEQDNNAWAKEMANIRKGTNLEAPNRQESRNRTVKPSGLASSASASSNGGAEADDDLSPALSPSFTAGDVSDMLEKPAGGPSVLRLTDTSDPRAARQAKHQKEFQTAETKRQRQNRKKVDDRKLERDAAERERQTKLENQRRTAREARGEPAKNGIPASKPPTNSAWAANAIERTVNAPVTAASTHPAPLLDTFDPHAESTSTGALANGTASARTVGNLDPEVQSETTGLGEDPSGWNTVAGKKKQKKAGTNGESEIQTPVEKPSVPAPTPKVAPTPAPVSTNGFASLGSSLKYDAGSHPDDSQWDA